MESITEAEDMPCDVLILAFIANVSLKSRVRENRKYRYNNVANSLEIMQIIPRAFTLNNPGEKFTCEVNSLSSSLKIVYPCLNLME